jgi:hypothetical protein
VTENTTDWPGRGKDEKAIRIQNKCSINSKLHSTLKTTKLSNRTRERRKSRGNWEIISQKKKVRLQASIAGHSQYLYCVTKYQLTTERAHIIMDAALLGATSQA